MPSARLTPNQVAYLEGLVRSHMKKTRKGIARFERKAYQTEQEALEFRARLEDKLRWQESVLHRLRSLRPGGEEAD